jgi:outer membrane protein OmpA-like peptidoglycan-associated protein
MTRTLVRLAAVLTVALATSACSTISDLIGDDTPSSAAPTDANGYPADAAPPASSNGGTAPDLAAIPDKPAASTPDDQRSAADSLAADASRSHYSADALRGGTEAAAAPPPPASAEQRTPIAANTPPAPSPEPVAANSDNATPPAPSSAPPAPAPTTPVASMPAPPPAGTQPAVAATGGIPGSQPMVMADAPLGFKPSSAPPLDPSISQFVAEPIIARYQETAASAGVATGPIAPVTGGSVTPSVRPRHHRGEGGPETMSGSVVANLDVLNGTSTPSVYANAVGGTPQAVVLFPGDGTALTAAGRAQVRAAVQAFQQRGGMGFIKVVGHSSSRTSNMPVEKHLVAIFAKSQARANAVAREIIRQGVPASRVLVEAVGDSQPVYYESMPEGEAGNRRAEIFIQG